MADWILVIVRLSWIFSSMDSDKMGCCRSSATTLLSDVHISDDLGVLLMLGDGTDLKTFFWKIEMAFFLSEYWIASICSLLCWYHTTLPEMAAKQSSMGKFSNTRSCCFSSPYSFILQGYDVPPTLFYTHWRQSNKSHVPWDCFIFCLALKVKAYFGRPVTKSLDSPKWHWLILAPIGANVYTDVSKCTYVLHLHCIHAVLLVLNM